MITPIEVVFIFVGIYCVGLIIWAIWKIKKDNEKLCEATMDSDMLRKTKNDDETNDGVIENTFEVDGVIYHQRAGIRGDSQEGRELQKVFDDFDERVKKGEAKVYHEEDLR